MARKSKIFADKAIVTLSYETLEPLLPDSIHRIASITKFFTATAVFTLIDDGKLRLSQPVSDFIEEFKTPPFNHIGITNLLTHTSGLGVDPGALPEDGNRNVYDYISEEFDHGGTNWIAAALKAKLRYQPGEQWAYASFGFTILGEIIQRITGRKLQDYVTERILIPCEMTNTSYALSEEQLICG